MALKDQLEAAGYDTSSLNEDDIISKLDAAGYDTSTLKSAPQNTSPFQADKGKLTVAEQRKQGPINPSTEYNKFTSEMQNTGTEMAEKIGEKAAGTPLQRIAPYAGAAIGTTVAMAPDIITQMATAPGSAVTATKVGRTAAKAVGPLRKMAEVLTGPGEAKQALRGVQILNPAKEALSAAEEAASAAKQVPEALSNAKAELPQMGNRMNLLKQQRQGLVKKAGEEIGKFEADLGPIEVEKLKQVMSDPETLQATINGYRQLAQKGPKAIQKVMTAKDIRFARQLVQEVGRNPGIKLEGVEAGQLNKAFGEAMDTYKPGYKDALDMYKQAQEALDDMPNIKTKEFGELRSKISQMETQFKNSKLASADKVKQARLHVRQIQSKVDEMVAKGKLSDEARKKFIYALVGSGLVGTGATAAVKYLH